MTTSDSALNALSASLTSVDSPLAANLADGEFQRMLLWMSRADLEVGSYGLVDLAGDVALEAADDVLGGFLFGCASGPVGAGGVVVA